MYCVLRIYGYVRKYLGIPRGLLPRRLVCTPGPSYRPWPASAQFPTRLGWESVRVAPGLTMADKIGLVAKHRTGLSRGKSLRPRMLCRTSPLEESDQRVLKLCTVLGHGSFTDPRSRAEPRGSPNPAPRIGDPGSSVAASAGETDRDLAGRQFPRNCLPYNIIEF